MKNIIGYIFLAAIFAAILYYLPMIDYNNYLESVEKKNKKIRGRKITPLTYKPYVKHWYFNLLHGQSNKE